jgi:hypothetical protein
MPYCPSCGAEYPEGHRSCPNCGVRFSLRPAPPSSASSSFPWKILVAILVVLIVAGIGVLLVLAATGAAEIPVLSPLFPSPTPTATPQPGSGSTAKWGGPASSEPALPSAAARLTWAFRGIQPLEVGPTSS